MTSTEEKNSSNPHRTGVLVESGAYRSTGGLDTPWLPPSTAWDAGNKGSGLPCIMGIKAARSGKGT